MTRRSQGRPLSKLRALRLAGILGSSLLSACSNPSSAHRPGAEPPPPAQAAQVRAKEPSLPELKRLSQSPDERPRAEAFDAAYRTGAPAIPFLVDELHDRRAANRERAVDLLIDLAPETEPHQAALSGALNDSDVQVVRDAARALGALAGRAAPSVPSLIQALDHGDAHVRLYAAEALASIGPPAAAATERLSGLLADPVPGVRWAACEALGRIGPAAASAVPPLIAALKDDSLYVRICAAGALGGIGPDAQSALQPLADAAAIDPALGPQAQWAIHRITGAQEEPATASIPAAFSAPRPPAPAPRVSHAQVPADKPTTDLPLDWDVTTGRNVRWTADLGHQTFGRPVVSGGTVFIGTDNASHRDPAIREDCGVLMAFRASDGAFLWQDAAPRSKRETRDFLLPSTTSAPYVDGEFSRITGSSPAA